MILVDWREGSWQLVEPLRKMGLPAEKSDGDIDADLVWEGRGEGGRPVLIGVEYKKLGELVQSLRTERLQGHQLLKMRAAFEFCYLLIEGEWHYDEKGCLTKRTGRNTFVPMPGRMGVGELLKRLMVLHLRGGIIPLWASNRATTLRIIEALYRTWTDCDLDQHKSHIAIYQAPTLTPISEFRQFVTRFHGLGIRTSLAVEKHFKGNLRQALNAPKEEWMKVDGVGPVLAGHIQDVLDGRTDD